MKALVIQHDHVSPPGPVGDRLVERGYDLDLHLVVERDNFHRPHLHNPFPGLDGVDLVVTMGAPWSAYDESIVGAWVARELEVLREADRLGIPVLGICFGGQLLAAAHGGTVLLSDQAELGWVRVSTDDASMISTGPWFQWHFDRWLVPPGALEVARNEVASQAFVLRRNLAVQFHPELTVAMLEGWFANGGDAKAIEVGGDPGRLRDQTVAEEPGARERASRLVDAFLDQVAQAGPPA